MLELKAPVVIEIHWSLTAWGWGTNEDDVGVHSETIAMRRLPVCRRLFGSRSAVGALELSYLSRPCAVSHTHMRPMRQQRNIPNVPPKLTALGVLCIDGGVGD